MEEAISAEIAEWNSPSVQLATVECRESLCRIAMYRPPDAGLAAIGQQLSYLYKLGLDHQGETDDSYERSGDQWRYRIILVARRR
jgi:hypothetical protein